MSSKRLFAGAVPRSHCCTCSGFRLARFLPRVFEYRQTCPLPQGTGKTLQDPPPPRHPLPMLGGSGNVSHLATLLIPPPLPPPYIHTQCLLQSCIRHTVAGADYQTIWRGACSLVPASHKEFLAAIVEVQVWAYGDEVLGTIPHSRQLSLGS